MSNAFRVRREDVRSGACSVLGLVAVLSFANTLQARAESLTAGTADCGGDAFSTAEVIEKRPARHGPVTAVPQTLCADLMAQQPPANVEIGVYPVLRPSDGASGPSAPYEGWPTARGGHSRP